MPTASFKDASPGKKSVTSKSVSTAANTANCTSAENISQGNEVDYLERYQMRDLNKNVRDNEDLIMQI